MPLVSHFWILRLAADFRLPKKPEADCQPEGRYCWFNWDHPAGRMDGIAVSYQAGAFGPDITAYGVDDWGMATPQQPLHVLNCKPSCRLTMPLSKARSETTSI